MSDVSELDEQVYVILCDFMPTSDMCYRVSPGGGFVLL
jgi:hypothetical protein